MSLHPSIVRLSERFRPYVLVSGLTAAAVYLPTLSPGTAPGVSAALTAAAAGLLPPSGAAHPLFAWAARAAAALPVFALPVRLNLFSALCGVLCTALFYRFVARLILFSVCESEARVRGAWPEGAERELPPEIARHNARAWRIALWSGLAAALFLIFSAPVWSASVRLDCGMFDLLLALASLNLFPVTRTAWRVPALVASVFMFTLGLLESAAFLFLLPFYAWFLLKAGLSMHRRFVFLGWIFLGGAVGLAVMVLTYRLNTDDASSPTGFLFLESYARRTISCLYHEARSFFPRSGWVLLSLQVGLVAGVLAAGRRTLLFAKRPDTVIAQLLLLLGVAPGLLLLPRVAPLFVYAPLDHLPVFAYAVLALGAAVALASGLLVLAPDDRPQEEEAAQSESGRMKQGRQVRVVRAFATGLIFLLLGLALAVPTRGFPKVREGRGLFVDAVARELLAAMKGRTWLVSDGVLDDHLRIQALSSGRPLVLVSLRPRYAELERKRLDGFIAADPLFDGLNRQRLRNALSIGPTRFVSEWLHADTNAWRRVMVAAMPDLWTSCGYRAVPEGLAFGGVPAGQKPDAARLAEENRRFREAVEPLLADTGGRADLSDMFRQWLRTKLGFAADELGVFLEESGDFETAYQTYEEIARIDPANMSAAINAYGLTVARKLHPEAHDRLKGRIKNLLADRRLPPQALPGVVQRYGTVRLPEFYQREAALWAASGDRAVTDDKLRKALAVADQTGAASLTGKALCYLQLGDRTQAEDCYRAALAADASDRGALLGLLNLALDRRNAKEAEMRLKAALDRGLDEKTLLYQTVQLALLKNDLVRARKLLTGATAECPMQASYWSLLAEVMVKQGDALLVQQALLPQMEKAVGPEKRYLVDAIRGVVLCRTDRKRLPEGRLLMLKSLSCNAAQPNLWESLLKTDMAIGRLDFIETDARNLLGREPDHPRANYLLGSVLLRRGEWAGAEDFLRRSVDKEPTAMGCNDLAETLRLLKKTPDAERFARKAVALDPTTPFVHDTLAGILYERGNYDESAQEAARAAQAAPDRPVYQINWLRALVKEGDISAVRQKLKELKHAKIAIPEEIQKELRKLSL